VNPSVVAAAGITVAAIFLFIAEADGLVEGHARVRTLLFDAMRWVVVAGLAWLLIPVAFTDPGPQRVAIILGLAGLIGAVILIPVRWFVRLGGRKPKWELRRTKIEVAQIANRVRRNSAAVSTARIGETITRLGELKTPDTAELCDLLTAALEDLLAGKESWNEAGRRSIRIDQLCRALWPEDMPLPDNGPGEATFRWQLYRTFGQMMEIAASRPSEDSVAEFEGLCSSLEEFRRPDVYRFIDAVQQAADRWLAMSSFGRPWIDSYDFAALGPDGLTEIKSIWGREAAMWGAHLDREDLAALELDLARRGRPPEPEPAPVAAPEPGREEMPVEAQLTLDSVPDFALELEVFDSPDFEDWPGDAPILYVEAQQDLDQRRDEDPDVAAG
jgi:hypothetical protein